MAWFANPIRGALGAGMVKLERSAHQTRYPEKDLRKRAGMMYSEVGTIEAAKEQIKKALKLNLKKELKDAEKGEIDAIKQVVADLNESIKDVAAISQLIMECLVELIREDERLKAYFKEISVEEERAIFANEQLKTLLNRAGDTLKRMASSI